MGLFSAIGNVVGSVIGASSARSSSRRQARSIKDTNQQNYKIHKENLAYNERMSNSAYQRATADMRAANINPMLAHVQGGASTPTANSFQMQPEVSDTAAGIEANNAKEAVRQVAELAQMRASVKKTRADAAASRAAESATRQNEKVARQEEKNKMEANKLIKEQVKVHGANAKMMNAQLPKVKAKANVYKQYKYLAPAEKLMEMFGTMMGGANSARRVISPSSKGPM